MPSFRALIWALAVLGCAAVVGCGGHERLAIKGKVTINGTPMDLGMITFKPDDPAEGRTSVGGKVTNGNYFLDATRGPLPGKYRVQISWSKKTGKKISTGDGGMQDETKEGLPAKFNKDTELTTEVTSRTSRADFNLTP